MTDIEHDLLDRLINYHNGKLELSDLIKWLNSNRKTPLIDHIMKKWDDVIIHNKPQMIFVNVLNDTLFILNKKQNRLPDVL